MTEPLPATQFVGFPGREVERLEQWDEIELINDRHLKGECTPNSPCEKS